MNGFITLSALQGRSLAQLQALGTQLRQELARTPTGTPEHQSRTAQLQTLSIAIARKQMPGPRF